MSWQQYQQHQQHLHQQRQQQYQQQYQQQQPQHIASGQTHASYALSHPSVVYSPYQQYSYAAQNSSSNSLQWAYPSSSSVSAASTVPAARGKGLSYAELLRRAESQSHPQGPPSQAQPATAAAAAHSNPPPPPPPQSYSAPPQAPAYRSPAPQQPAPVISKKWTSPPTTVRPPISNPYFAGSSGSVPAAPTNAGGGGNEDTANYPPNLLKHVERSFAQCKTPEEKNWVQGELRSSIQRAVSENRLWTLNWDTVPLPLNRKRKQKQSQPQKQIQPLSNRKKKKQKRLEKKKAAEGKKATEELTKQKKGLSLSTRDLTTMKNSESIRERNLRFGHVTDYSATTSQKLRMRIGNGFEEEIKLNWEELKIKGTCQTLEKEYLRLTSAPDPATVRPETVLKKALMLVLNKYRKEQNYFYLCQQMKSIRQDMSIQHIVNDFAVNVYERNARICIQVGDFSEYNQCQTQLSELYEDRPELEKNRDEFLSFQLYYYMSTKDVSSLMHLIANMSQRSKKDPLVSHALAVRRSLLNHDYVNFFRLYSSATALARCCMKHSTAAMRFRALKTMLKAYRPSIPVSLISSLLAFPSEDVCVAYLRESGVVLDESETKVVVKLCQPQSLSLVSRSALLGDDSKDYGITHGQF